MITLKCWEHGDRGFALEVYVNRDFTAAKAPRMVASEKSSFAGGRWLQYYTCPKKVVGREDVPTSRPSITTEREFRCRFAASNFVL